MDSDPSSLLTEMKDLVEFKTKIPDKRCIYKVHEQLCDVSEKAYKPVLLAIGPYNDQDKVGQGFMKEHKLRYLQQMIEETEVCVETYIMALRSLEKEARKYYLECNRQTSDEFVKMMLLDGCFIIELFRKYEIYKKTRNEAHKDDPIFRMKWVLSRIARDLLLFENQLPLFVLAKLFGMSERGSRRTSLTVLALRFLSNYLPFGRNVDATNCNSKHKIENLLCVMHKAQTLSLRRMVIGRLKLGFRIKNEEFKHLLGLIHASISISILDTEINKAIEPHEKEMAEICKHVFCLTSEALIGLLAKIKNKRNPEGGEGYSEDNMPKTDQGREMEFIPVRSELKEVRIKMAAELKNDVNEIKGWGSDHGYSEDNMPKTDQDRERKLIPVCSELKKVRVKRDAAPAPEIEGCGSNEEYSGDNMPETDQDREMELSPVRSELKKEVIVAAAPAYKIEDWGSDDGYFEDNMTDQDREMLLNTVVGAAPSHEIEEFTHFGRHYEDNMPNTDEDSEMELRMVSGAAPMNEECRVSDGHSEDNMPKTDKLDWFLTELEKAKVKTQMRGEFEKDFYEIKRWEDELNAPCASELFEAGIEFEKASKFMDLVRDHKHQMTIPYRKFLRKAGIETKKARKFMDLLCLKVIERWEDESIPCASELQEAGIEFEKAKKFMVLVRDLHHRHRNEDQMSIPYRKFLRKAGIETKKARKFMDLLDLKEIERWEDESIPCASKLQEAGIEFKKAKKFMVLVRDREHQMSIPYRKFLREAGIKTKKANRFMDLLDLKEIEAFNIHTATELEEAGIEFKKSTKDKKSKEENMFCIKFNKGKMEVSPLSIEDQTETCFRNLIAYEQYSCDGDKDLNYVTDYVSFIDSLIDSPKDVQLLRDRGIIQNCLGDDEVISKMVNKLVHNINLRTSIYARTSKNMNMHCRKLWPKWKAKLRHDYFNSPWAWISFLAAVLLLGLTIVQTIFSIIP